MTRTNSPRVSCCPLSPASVASGAASHLLVQLGQFAAEGGFAFAESGGKIGQRFGNPRSGFEQDQRGRRARQFGNAGAPRGLLRRQKAGKEKLVGRQARDRQGGQHRRGSGYRGDRVARLLRRANELIARIGNQRRAGVRYQRDRRPFHKLPQKLGACCRGVVIVVGCERTIDRVTFEQLAGHPRVLAGDEVGGRKRGQRAQRDVAEVADGGGHNMKPGLKRCRRHKVAVKTEAATQRTIASPGRAVGARLAHRRHRSGKACAGHVRRRLAYLSGLVNVSPPE